MSGAGERGPALPIAVNADSLATWFLPALGRVAASHGSASTCTARTRSHTGRAAAGGTGDGRGDLLAGTRAGLHGARAGRDALPADGHARSSPRAGSPTARSPRRWPGAPGGRLRPQGRPAGRASCAAAAGRPAAPAPCATPSPTSEGFVAAVAAGLGWGMVPEVQAEPPAALGRAGRPRPRPAGRRRRCTGSSGSSTRRRWRRWRTPWPRRRPSR